MAIKAPIYPVPGMWNSGDLSNTFPSSGPGEAQTSMSYQYPPPSSGLENSSNLISEYHNPALEHIRPQSPARIKPESPIIKSRAGAGAKSAKVKKSMSTPNVRGQAAADAAALASAEKRRNKLGYHRTSVACGMFRSGRNP